METENDSTLSFLDILRHRKEQDLTINYSSGRKAHPHRFLPEFEIQSLFNSLERHGPQIVSHPDNLQTEPDHLQKVFFSTTLIGEMMFQDEKKDDCRQPPMIGNLWYSAFHM